jgi:uncharacterized short protein YbdD (DUF466 family)
MPAACWNSTAARWNGLPTPACAYETYVAHRRANHPEQPIMTYAEFFRERQLARYAVGNGRFRGCYRNFEAWGLIVLWWRRQLSYIRKPVGVRLHSNGLS